VQGGLLLDVVIGQGAAILELLAGENETLLVRRNSLFVLNFRFHIVDGVGGFDLERDGLARQGLHEDLHDEQLRFCTTKTMKKKAASGAFLHICNTSNSGLGFCVGTRELYREHTLRTPTLVELTCVVKNLKSTLKRIFSV